MKIVVIGAGVMGLGAALDLLEEGHDVEVLEAAGEPGGLAGSFDFGGVSAERFYHFLCGADRVYFRWLDRLGIRKHLRWRKTSMAMFRSGRLRRFGDPLSLAAFGELSPLARLRYGLSVLGMKGREDWRELEDVPARDWLVEGAGEEAYEVIWEPLLRQKFARETETISAAWIWSRVHRLASSRDRLFREWLGYLEGGSQTFVTRIVAAIQEKGGRIRCGTPVERVYAAKGRASGVRTSAGDHPADAVVSTVPLAFLVRMTDALPEDYVNRALDLGNIGVRCILLKLSEPLTPHFWINVNDPLPVCGLIEYTNLNPPSSFGGDTLVYSPLYIEKSHPRYAAPDEDVLEETLEVAGRIAKLDRSSVKDFRVFREPHAQPVCPVGFTRRLAPLQTPVANLVAADTTHLLPHDRSISDSLALAERLVAALRESRS